MKIVGYRIIEDDGTAVGPFTSRAEAQLEAEHRARRRGHGLTWTPIFGKGVIGRANDYGPGVFGCRIEPMKE